MSNIGNGGIEKASDNRGTSLEQRQQACNGRAEGATCSIEAGIPGFRTTLKGVCQGGECKNLVS